MAVLRATWQRGLPATSPWKLEIIGYTSIGRTELGLSHIKNNLSTMSQVDKIDLLKIEHDFFEEAKLFYLKMHFVSNRYDWHGLRTLLCCRLQWSLNIVCYFLIVQKETVWWWWLRSFSSDRSSSSLEWSSIAISSESLKWECGENSPSLPGDSFLPPPTAASELPARLEGEGEGEHIASSTMAENEASS